MLDYSFNITTSTYSEIAPCEESYYFPLPFPTKGLINIQNKDKWLDGA